MTINELQGKGGKHAMSNKIVIYNESPQTVTDAEAVSAVMDKLTGATSNDLHVFTLQNKKSITFRVIKHIDKA